MHITICTSKVGNPAAGPNLITTTGRWALPSPSRSPADLTPPSPARCTRSIQPRRPRSPTSSSRSSVDEEPAALHHILKLRTDPLLSPSSRPPPRQPHVSQPPPNSPPNVNNYSICSSEASKSFVDAKLLHNPPALLLAVALPLLLRLEWTMMRGIAELEIGAWWAEEICDGPEYRALEEEAIRHHRLQHHLILRSAPIFNSFDSPSGFIHSNVMVRILMALRLSGILMGDILILTRISPPPAFPLLRLATSIFGYAHGVIGLSNTVSDLRLLLPKYC